MNEPDENFRKVDENNRKALYEAHKLFDQYYKELAQKIEPNTAIEEEKNDDAETRTPGDSQTEEEIGERSNTSQVSAFSQDKKDMSKRR